MSARIRSVYNIVSCIIKCRKKLKNILKLWQVIRDRCRIQLNEVMLIYRT